MARIAGVDLPHRKRIVVGLTYIYGVGRSTAEEILAKARQEVEQLKERIDREIDAATKRAYEEVWKSAGSLGVEIASKVLEREIQADDHQKMIASSVQAFQSSISGQGVS